MSLPNRALLIPIVLFAACSAPRDEPAAKAPAQAFTHFTDRSELFVEFPALVKGQESAFAVHLTRLADFKPVSQGRVTVVLSGGGQPEERFEVDRPTVPGIFRPIARPAAEGERRLEIVLMDDEGEDRHDLGQQRIYASVADARAAAAPEEEAVPGVAFLKEQQWRTDFAMAVVVTRPLRGSIAANGTLRARSDGEARVTAPVAGRLAVGAGALPVLGSRVRRNQALAVLFPLVRGDVDLASLEQAVTRARLTLDTARRERERLEQLYADEAVPERRLVAARNEESAAEADFDSSRRRLDQHLRTQSADAGPVERLTLRAPLDGTVVEILAAPGVIVEQGYELFRIVDLERLWLEVRIPEAEIARARLATAASFRVQGYEDEFEAGGKDGGRVIGLGGVLDATSRTVPLLFELLNPQGMLRVGMSARVRVYSGEAHEVLAIPLSALVDEGGKDVAYVQVDGEAFARRVVKLGIRDRDHVQVIEGLAAGERIVTRGAYEVRLAASSTSVPAHGHAH